MSGVDIIGAVMTGATAITSRVPNAQIKAGALPDDAPLPSLLVRSVSEIERVKLRRTGKIRVTERVEVMARTASYRDTAALRIIVRDTCSGLTGNFGGGSSVAITNAGAGPELRGPNLSFERSQDFRVTYEIAA